MNEDERKALETLRFDWAPVPDDVWRPSPYHVEGLHPRVVGDVLAGIADAKASKDGSPLGLHTNFVVAVEGNAITTVGGNEEGGIRVHTLDDAEIAGILGYGRLTA